MAISIAAGLFLAGSLATLVGLRFLVWRRGRMLPRLLEEERAQWGALCRVKAGGRFLDQGRKRAGGGPRGVLVADDNMLHWLPDGFETRHGDRPCAWQLRDVRCVSARHYRGVSGVTVEEFVLTLPDGDVRLAVFHPVGSLPDALRR